MTRQIQKIVILRTIVIILLLGTSGGWGLLSESAAETAQNDLMAEGHRWYGQGNFEQAAESWAQASTNFQQSGDHPDHIQALIYESRALTEMGKNQRAQLLLQTAVQKAQTYNQARLMAQALDQLGALHLTVGEAEQALSILQEGLKISRDIQDRPLVATILNDLGNTHSFLNNPTAAIAAYTEASILADSVDLHSLSIRAMVNAGLVEMRTDASSNATLRLQQAWDKTRNLPDSHEKVQNFLTIGRGLRDISRQDTENHASLFLQASEALRNGIHTAKAIGDWKQESYGWGFLAEMYEEEGRHREALKLTQLAIRASQQGQAPEALYLWEWKTGQHLKKLGQLDEAILAYQRAIDTLRPIRQELVAGLPNHPTAFRESIGGLYFEMAHALLERADQLADGSQRNGLLYQTRDTMEGFKAAELQDYFKDDCVEAQSSQNPAHRSNCPQHRHHLPHCLSGAHGHTRESGGNHQTYHHPHIGTGINPKHSPPPNLVRKTDNAPISPACANAVYLTHATTRAVSQRNSTSTCSSSYRMEPCGLSRWPPSTMANNSLFKNTPLPQHPALPSRMHEVSIVKKCIFSRWA